MASSFRLVQTPLNRAVIDPSGNGLLGDLGFLVSSRQLSASMTEPDQLSFTISVPSSGEHSGRAAEIARDATDVIWVYDGKIVQRFRVMGVTWSGQGASSVQMQVTCMSYAQVLAKHLIHDQNPADAAPRTPRLNWPSSGTDTVLAGNRTPSAVMNTILTQDQALGGHALGITLGYHSVLEVPLDALDASVGGTVADATFLSPGKSVLESLNNVANMQGTEWSIDPDPAAPMTAMLLNVWGKNGRGAYPGGSVAGLSPFVVGGPNLGQWSVTDNTAEFANVVRVSGLVKTTTSTEGETQTHWNPATKVPVQIDYGDGHGTRWPEQGAQEKDVAPGNTVPLELTELLTTELAKASDLLPTVQVAVPPGRWPGPDVLWIGDWARVSIPAIGLSQPLRVMGAQLSVNEDGVEQASFTFTRPPRTQVSRLKSIIGRIEDLEDAAYQQKH